ncbi:Vacuolar fusion protein mon1-like protein [Thalictrum thalictroides]|uniref:Vacuolar fusion protein MON1 homolog n=1 Tax=Thalictrum thalictroides TaxID=46969 RepID=A0A7J6W9N3_THATH|nr:Vacuolar fusion protein mon1-like protein [Thalictrum thalictroides]
MESESNLSIDQNPNPNSLEVSEEDHLKFLTINAKEEEVVVNSEKRSEEFLNGSMNSNCDQRVPTSENEEEQLHLENEEQIEVVIGSVNSVDNEEELIVEKELQRDSTLGSVGTDVFEEVGESFSPSEFANGCSSGDYSQIEEPNIEEETSMSEVVRESISSDVVRRENSEIEFDAQSNPSSSGYVGERGSNSSSASTVSDEIEEVEEDGSFDRGVVTQQNDNSSNGVYDSASWVPGKRHDEEDDASISWRKRKKHFFVLSHSGKPIYSRYGDEHKLAGFSATLQAIISFVENGDDRVKFVRAGKHQVVFLVKGPIYLVCISCTEEPHEALTGQLELLYGQLLLILTKSVNRCFEKNSKFDMTPLLGGTDVVFSSLIHSFSWNPAAFLHAYTCLPLAYPTRQAAGAILQDVADSGVLFAILMCKHKVVSLVGAQKASLHPDDMLLLANFVLSSESFRTSESFSPICLPRYNPMAFLYAYIHYLDVDTYLILLTTSSDAFFHLKDCRLRIEMVLLKSNVLSEVQKSILEGGLHVEDLPIDPSPRTGYLAPHLGHDRSRTESPSRSGEVNPGIGGPAGLWHFIYRSINLDQYVSSEFSSPINSSRQQKRLYRAYQKLYASMHDRGIGPNKTQFRRDEDYVLLCWITQDFELYAAFDPLADKALAIKTCNRVCQWVRDVENEIFLLGASPFSW